MKSGAVEGLPYSLSRWTDIPASKWDWFKDRLQAGSMRAFDQRECLSDMWSLDPKDVYGLVFWTKDPRNLINDRKLLEPYPVVVHLTLTGWEEAELNAPKLSQGLLLLQETVEAFGPSRVVWRFSPIPQLDILDILDRFSAIARVASDVGLRKVYTVFLQENDLMPESRPQHRRRVVLEAMASAADQYGITVELCRDDADISKAAVDGRLCNLKLGVCEDGRIFGGRPPVMDCGCALAIDPFTINEACSMGCQYCYAANRSLSPHKRNTTLKAIS